MLQIGEMSANDNGTFSLCVSYSGSGSISGSKIAEVILLEYLIRREILCLLLFRGSFILLTSTIVSGINYFIILSQLWG